jgi:psiF repeat
MPEPSGIPLAAFRVLYSKPEVAMIRTLASLALGLSIAGAAWAQDKPTAQQERMKSCNAQASKKELKGDERKDFMSKCLRADSGKGDKELTAQQKKMRTCNAQASKKELKGDERKAFMSKCLKADSGDGDLTAQQEKMKSCNAQANRKELKGDKRREFMSECLSA